MLTREERNRIDELAASFFNGSGDIQAVSEAIRELVERRRELARLRKEGKAA
jgi:hypothetical protein